jgi:tetratricopeptide (TPR) repeat protein
MYLEQGNYLQAEKYWFHLLEMDPNSSRAHYQLGNIYLNYENSNLINLEKAEIEFKKALHLNKEETGSLLYLGRIYLLQEKDDLAKEYFTAVIGSNYTSVEAYFLSGYLAWAGKNQKEALSFFTNAIKYATPQEGMGNADGEGATKDGKSLQRENQNLLFYTHIEELSNLEGTNMSLELPKRYTALEAYINQFKEKLDNHQ